jgi:DNA (cytosine-5)-methyltransferase 1
MAEISAIPWNGYTAISTFSGCGGSSLGYKLAGFRVAWANEFVPAARDTYRANAPETILDPRDIREITPESILAALGLTVGQLDVLDGSPPCASFSTAGKREAGWGKIKTYSDTKQRTDDLFFEYARLVRGIQPRIFIAENVSGLVKGTAKGYFKEILRELKECGYRVEARLLDAQWLGVPQMRQRVIFFGVREDLDATPRFPKPLPYRYSVRDALPWIIAQGDNGGFGHGSLPETSVPSPTIGAGPQTGNGAYPPSLVSARAMNDTRGQASYSMGDVTDIPAPSIVASGHHLWVEEANGLNSQGLGPGEQSDKYYSLVRTDPERPSPTVTQRGGDGGDATITHPTERRKFTIAELKRICAFPDDFVLTGTYAQQWERLGRAVPPLMMAAIAEQVRVVLEEIP